MRRHAPLIAVLAIALLARAAATGLRGFSRPPAADEKGYAGYAGSLAAGRGFRLDLDLKRGGETVAISRLASRPPLYPAALAGWSLLAGGSPAAGRALSVLLGTAGVLALFLLARAAAGERAALLAALLYALYPSAVYASGEMLSEPAAILLLLLHAAALVRGRGLLAGLALGLAILARPAGAVLLPVAWLAVAVGPAFAGRRRLLSAAAVTVAALAVVLPWMARNEARLGRWIIASNSGVTFAGGNCDAALRDRWPGKWHRPEEAIVSDPPDLGYHGWSGLGEAESDREFLRRGLSWIREHPERFATLLLFKTVRFGDPDQHSGQPDRGLKAWAGWLSWPPVLLLALWGARRTRRRWRELAPVGGLIAGHLVVALVFYGDARMRMPAEPAFLLLAGVALAGALGRLRAEPTPR